MLQRRIAQAVTVPAPAPGFAGPFHSAVEVVTPDALPATDPFVLLMDDRLEVSAPRQVGGPHPHAGIETVTLILEGTVRDRDEGSFSPGDAVWMSAGRGVIHNESIEVSDRTRILQLWIRLPAEARGTPPRFELIRKASLPVRREPGVEVRLYSGTSGSLRSPTLNHVPVTLADFTLAPHATVEQDLPLSYNGFFYVLDGSVGVAGTTLSQGQVGWIDRPEGNGLSAVQLRAGDQGGRVVLYAGEPQHEPLIHYGPFVAPSEAAIGQLFREFRAGKFTRMSELVPVHMPASSFRSRP